MLLVTLGASLFGIILAGKGMNRAGEGFLRAGYESSIKKWFLIPPHPLTNFEIQKYYYYGVHPRDNLSDKIKNGYI